MMPLGRSSAQQNQLRFAELRRTVGDRKALWIAPLWAMTKRYLVIIRNLTDVSDLPVAYSAYTCHGLESSSPAELVSFDRRLSEAEIDGRIAAGQICEIWRLDSRIVHFRWLSTVRVSLPFLGLDFEPLAGDLLLFEVFTLADKRVRGIHTNVARHSLRRASDGGFQRMVALCAWWNAPALRVAEKNGFKIAGAVTRWQLGPVATFSTSRSVQVQGKTLSVLESRDD